MSETRVVLGTAFTTVAQVEAVARGALVSLDPEARARTAHMHERVADVLASGEKVYGLTTGVGDLYLVDHDPRDVADVQLDMLRSHASGVGEPHDEPVVRAVMAVLLQALAQGHSGVSVELLDTFTEMLNRGVTPWAPSHGSVGYLIATAHIGLVAFGEGRAWFDGRLLPGAQAMRAAGIPVRRPGPREGHALLSGTYEISGIGALAMAEAARLVLVADAAAALSLEAVAGSSRGYDERVHRLRPHPGQVETARRMRRLLAGSQIVAPDGGVKLQEALSLRCVPQVHGAFREVLGHGARVLETEICSVTDNPVLFLDGDTVVAVSGGGNGHGAPAALALDAAAIGVSHVSSMSQVRSERLTTQRLSGLPPFLTQGPAGSSGLMIPPYVAAALAAENRGLAAPASVHSVSTCAGQEDHISLGTTAAVQLRQAVANAAQIIAVELLCAAAGLDFRAPHRPGRGTASVYAAVREVVPRHTGDRELAADLQAINQLIGDGTIPELVERCVRDDTTD